MIGGQTVSIRLGTIRTRLLVFVALLSISILSPASLLAQEKSKNPDQNLLSPDNKSLVLKKILLDLFDKDEEKRFKAVGRLGETKDLRVCDLLFFFTHHNSDRFRLTAIAALGEIPDFQVALHLRGILLSSAASPAARQAAAAALARHGNNFAAEVLYDALLELKEPLSATVREILESKFPERLAYIEALSRGDWQAIAAVEGDTTLAELLVALSDRLFPNRRRQAALSLAILGDPRSIAALEDLAAAGDEGLRGLAIDALGKLNHPRSTYALKRLLNERVNTQAVLSAMLAHDNPLAAGLLLDLVWQKPDLFRNEERRQQVEELIGRALPQRDRARKSYASPPDAAAEVEMLLDLLQGDSIKRRESALRRAAETRAEILAALVPELKKQSYAKFILPALEKYPQPEAGAILAGYIADPNHPIDLRLDAVEYLAFRKAPSAPDHLIALHQTSKDEQLKLSIRKHLTLYHLEAAQKANLVHVTEPRKNRSGVMPLAVSLGLHGGLGMYLVSEAANPTGGATIYLPVLGGTIIGVGSSLLLTWNNREFTTPQAFWVATGGLWGLTESALLGLALKSEDGDSSSRLGKALLFTGQTAGLAFSWLTRDSLGRSAGQQLFMDMSLLMGGLGGAGIAMQSNYSEKELATWALLGSSSGLVLSGLMGRNWSYQNDDYWQTSNSILLGSLFGGLLASSIHSEPSDEQIGGLAGIGASLGFATGALLSAKSDLSLKELAFLDLSLAMGSLGGWGAAWQKDQRSDAWTDLWILGGGLSGLATATLLGPRLKLSTADHYQILSTLGMAGWSGMQLAKTLQPHREKAATGGLMLGASLGYSGALVLSMLHDLPPKENAFISSAYLAGNLGALGLAWQKENPSEAWTAAWLLGGGALGLGAGLWGRDLKFEGLDYLQMTGMSLTGGWAGALIATAAQPGFEKARWGGLLLGSSLGYAAGSLLSSYTDPALGEMSFMATAMLAGNLGALGLALQDEHASDRDYALWLLGGSVSSLAASALWGPTLSFSGPDYMQIGGASLLGAWTGYWGMRAIRPGPENDRAAWGGSALMLSLGFAGGSVLSAFSDPSYEDIIDHTIGFGLGSALGGGTAMVIEDLPEWASLSLMLGGGWAGIAAAAMAEDRLHFSKNDRSLLLFGGAWGLYHGLALREAFGQHRYDADSRTMWGSALLGTTTGLIAAGSLAQFYELPPSMVGRVGLGGLYGSLIGGGLGTLIPALADHGPMALALSGGWAGLMSYV